MRGDGGRRAGGSAGDAKLCADVGHVSLDGAYRQRQTSGDLVVAASLCDESEDPAAVVAATAVVSARRVSGWRR